MADILNYLKLLCGVLIVTAGIIVFLRNRHALAPRLFLSISTATSFWLISFAIASLYTTPSLSTLKTLQVGYVGVTFLPPLIYHYTTSILTLPKRGLTLTLNYLAATGLSISILTTNHIVDGTTIFPWGEYPKAGLLHPLYLLWFIGTTAYSLVLVLKEFQAQEKNLSPRSLRLARILTRGFIIFAASSLDFLPNYGVNLIPFGFLPATSFIAIISFACIKYNLMNVNIAIQRSITYSLLVSMIALIYPLAILFIERLSQQLVGYQSIPASLLAATIITIIFIPLKTQLQKIVGRLTFTKSQEELVNEVAVLRKGIADIAKYQAIATFASGMAHEIKNPLTTILTFTEKLPQKLDDKEFLLKFSRLVGSEVNRINDLVHQLLDYAKPSPLSLRKTPIIKLLDETLDILSNNFIKKQASLSRNHRNTADIELMIDPNKFKQALVNILLNCLDAVPQNGTVELTTASTPAKFEIKITDNGTGITKEDLPRIFDPFFTKKDHGTGLGLSITYGIIQEHGGMIEVQSKPGEGTTFIISLPILQPSS